VLIFRRTIILTQPLVSSLSLGDRSVHRLREGSRSLWNVINVLNKEFVHQVGKKRLSLHFVNLNIFNSKLQLLEYVVDLGRFAQRGRGS